MNRARTKIVGSTGQMRRPLALLLLALGLLTITACGGSATSTPASGAGGPATTAPTAAATTAATAAATAATGGASPTRAASPAGSPAGAGATPNTAIKISGKQGDADTLNAAGATFPAPLYSKWFDEYAKLTTVKVNYQANGSGAGKKGITDQTVDFAGSDSSMTDQELADAKTKCGDTVLHFPSALGAIVVTYNVPGQENTRLKMDGDTIAGIFLGDINKWNDQKLKDLNPGVNLPNQDIIVVHRSDGSGTTDNFTSYLAAVNQKWASGPKSGTSVNWPVGIGASGNQGVAGELKNNPNSVGYVEQNFANQQKLPYADVKNKAGKFVTPSLPGVTAAAQAFAPTAPADFRFKIINADGDTSYPISVLTYLLVCPKQTDQAKAVAITRLF